MSVRIECRSQACIEAFCATLGSGCGTPGSCLNEIDEERDGHTEICATVGQWSHKIECGSGEKCKID